MLSQQEHAIHLIYHCITYVHVLCRVCPNNTNEVPDGTCMDVPVTVASSALQICSRLIRVTSVGHRTSSRHEEQEFVECWWSMLCELCGMLMTYAMWTMWNVEDLCYVTIWTMLCRYVMNCVCQICEVGLNLWIKWSMLCCELWLSNNYMWTMLCRYVMNCVCQICEVGLNLWIKWSMLCCELWLSNNYMWTTLCCELWSTIVHVKFVKHCVCHEWIFFVELMNKLCS
jgi:hypothetical protein